MTVIRIARPGQRMGGATKTAMQFLCGQTAAHLALAVRYHCKNFLYEMLFKFEQAGKWKNKEKFILFHLSQKLATMV